MQTFRADGHSEEAVAARGDGGFTLIELLVVIVILAILAAVVVFAVGGITDRGQTSACQADRNTIQTAEEAYYAKNQTYTDDGTLVTQKFLASTPTLHHATGNSSGYTITSTGVNNCNT